MLRHGMIELRFVCIMYVCIRDLTILFKLVAIGKLSSYQTYKKVLKYVAFFIRLLIPEIS